MLNQRGRRRQGSCEDPRDYGAVIVWKVMFLDLIST
jgi:hypothetical protein